MAVEKAVVCGSKMVRMLTVLLASGLAVYTVAPAVYWHVVADDGEILSKWVLQCPPCPPDLDGTLSSLADSAAKVTAIAQRLNSTTALQGFNPDMKEDVGRTLAQLLREGIKLQKEAKAAQVRSTSLGYLDASKKTVYRSPKGSTSEKGTTVVMKSIQGCAQAEADMAKLTTRANLWEKRAKDLGWKPKPGGYQKYKKYIQMLDGGA